MFQNQPDIILNFIPVEFNNTFFRGSELQYKNDDQLKELRERFRDSHVFRREGDIIQCVPLSESAEHLGKSKQFSTENNYKLTRKLVHETLVRFFKSKRQEFADLFPTIKVVLRKENIMANILENFSKDSTMFLYPQYEMEGRLILPHSGKVTYGIVLNFSTRHGFNATVKELLSKGIDVEDRYIVADREMNEGKTIIEAKYKRMLTGRVSDVNGDTLQLTDYRDVNHIDASKCYLEARIDNFYHCLNSLYPNKFEEIQEKRHAEIFKVTGAKFQVERLGKIISWLQENQPIKCASDLSFNVSTDLFSPSRGRDAGSFRMLRSPDCVLRPGGSITVRWPVDPHLEDKGPFDTESFPNKVPKIAVIFPHRYQGEVEVFIKQFRDGVPNTWKPSDKFIPYSQGFIRKYRLTGCDFTLHPLDGDADDAEAYRTKCLEVLGKGVHYDLAIVVGKEEFHNLKGNENPYLIMKSIFMSHGLPIQAVEIETIRDASRVYVLNNMAVACYAKLGGIPWVLSSVQGLTHELIFGIGSSKKGKGRLSGSERIIGITTVFSGDGNYLLSNVSKEVSFDEYQESLLKVLRNTLEQIKKRYAWQLGDKVRMIFHQTFKRYRNVEVAAIKDFVKGISDFDVEYAFVHISRRHPWKIFDRNSAGINHWINDERKVKGEFVPWRGCCVPLGPRAALVGLTGPHQLKTHLQGCPEPILVSLHPESTFTSLDYVVEQIYKLTFMSWRSFFPSTMPVTISYSDLIAELLGQLRDIPNWNPDILVTKLRESRWFL